MADLRKDEGFREYVYDDANGEPTANRKKSLVLLKDLLKSHPNHAAANHYWIHAVEGGPHPEAALASADKMADLAPASGHIVHMAVTFIFGSACMSARGNHSSIQ